MLHTRRPSALLILTHFLLYDAITHLQGIFVAGNDHNGSEADIRLYLYSRDSDTDGFEILSGNLSSLSTSTFSVTKSTKLLIHGWMDNANGYFAPKLRGAYLATLDVNVIVVDWSKCTMTLRRNINAMGKFLAQFIDWLVTESGVSVGSIHLIGFSLGAQLCGVVGEQVTVGRLGRITGLDPVGPTFGTSTSGRLDASDAQFVDVIHTCGKRLGYFDASGHVDFYPNGGLPDQPGCFLDFLGICSHKRSYILFTESIYNNKFISRKCGSWSTFTSGTCESNLQTVLGEYVDHNAEGNFYLHTASSSPYALS